MAAFDRVPPMALAFVLPDRHVGNRQRRARAADLVGACGDMGVGRVFLCREFPAPGGDHRVRDRERAKRTVGDRTDFEARRWLNAYRLELMERYEGYNSPILGVAQKPNRDALIREFEQWQFNPAISQTDAGQGIAQYMRARELAQREMVAQGFQPSSLATSQAGQVYRDWLRTQAQNILLANPSFGPVWVEVFSREIEEDELVVDDFSSAIDRILAP